MKIYLLTREDRNRLFNAAERMRLDPADFVWTDVEESYNYHLELKHKPTGYVFNLRASEHADRTVEVHGRLCTRGRQCCTEKLSESQRIPGSG